MSSKPTHDVELVDEERAGDLSDGIERRIVRRKVGAVALACDEPTTKDV